MAYAIGLLPFVLMRSATVTFLARGDTITPVKALFVAVVVNVALKVLLMDRYAQVGLALATSAGAWVNLALLVWFARRQNLITLDRPLQRAVPKIALAGAVLAAVLLVAEPLVARLFEGLAALRDVMTLLVLGLLGMVVYGGLVALMFGQAWLATLQNRRQRAAAPPEEQNF
jgi:putative peptidoglycan lipid II flippase